MKVLINILVDGRRESGQTYDSDIPLDAILLERDSVGIILTNE